MTFRVVSHMTQRAILVGIAASILAILAAIVLVPRAASQEPSPLEFVVVFTDESFEISLALGNELSDGPPGRGDVVSGQGAVYAVGDVGGERIGTWYFMGVGTAERQHFETAANHFYANGYLELFDKGTLAITGLVNYAAPYTAVITGGSGIYATASGQCTPLQTDEGETWTCNVR